MSKQNIALDLVRLKTTEQVAEELGIKKSTVQKWAKIFCIPSILGVLLFDEGEIERIRNRGDKRYGKNKSV